jgi:hypothetical protein
LERAELALAVGVVALQVAHLLLHHPLYLRREEHDRSFADADELLRAWGFEEELDAVEQDRESRGGA